MPTGSTKTATSNTAKRSSNQLSAFDTSDKQPIDDFVAYWKEYAKERPEVCAMWCFGLGFVIGWKLKPW